MPGIADVPGIGAVAELAAGDTRATAASAGATGKVHDRSACLCAAAEEAGDEEGDDGDAAGHRTRAARQAIGVDGGARCGAVHGVPLN